MEIVHDFPPIWGEILQAFPGCARFKPIFAWGTRIYNPYRIDVPLPLRVHEAVHGVQQGGDIRGWWRRYMDDMDFRLAQEVPAHAAEYEQMMNDGPRQARRRALREVAFKLASPLYGGLVTKAGAAELIKMECLALCETPNPT